MAGARKKGHYIWRRRDEQEPSNLWLSPLPFVWVQKKGQKKPKKAESLNSLKPRSRMRTHTGGRHMAGRHAAWQCRGILREKLRDA